jgi:hypothetical protein
MVIDIIGLSSQGGGVANCIYVGILFQAFFVEVLHFNFRLSPKVVHT